ncbi:MAG: PRD domain-containing protein [Solobacterium sp.]|nr:PRD domain-containing protein [Solobacterium sp.]
MKVIKNINNNVAVCLDSKGMEVVAFGKGIGFKKAPYDIELSRIQKTFYNVDTAFISMLNDIPVDIINISDDIIGYARDKLNTPLSSNIVFTLADHIYFTLERYEKNIKIRLPIVNDIQHLFEKEMDIGRYGIKKILKEKGIYLPQDEAAYIALHIINSQERDRNTEDLHNERMIDAITRIIEDEYGIKVNKEDFNYSRFVSHIHYLLKRGKKQELMKSDNDKIYQDLVREYPKTKETAETISRYIEKNIQVRLNDEAQLYLMLHINRLCTREGCYQ